MKTKEPKRSLVFWNSEGNIELEVDIKKLITVSSDIGYAFHLDKMKDGSHRLTVSEFMLEVLKHTQEITIRRED